ncbi:MAG: hypothetical protein WAK57_02680, partial [Desulfobacterales bacterium]
LFFELRQLLPLPPLYFIDFKCMPFDPFAFAFQPPPLYPAPEIQPSPIFVRQEKMPVIGLGKQMGRQGLNQSGKAFYHPAPSKQAGFADTLQVKKTYLRRVKGGSRAVDQNVGGIEIQMMEAACMHPFGCSGNVPQPHLFDARPVGTCKKLWVLPNQIFKRNKRRESLRDKEGLDPETVHPALSGGHRVGRS